MDAYTLAGEIVAALKARGLMQIRNHDDEAQALAVVVRKVEEGNAQAETRQKPEGDA